MAPDMAATVALLLADWPALSPGQVAEIRAAAAESQAGGGRDAATT